MLGHVSDGSCFLLVAVWGHEFPPDDKSLDHRSQSVKALANEKKREINSTLIIHDTTKSALASILKWYIVQWQMLTILCRWHLMINWVVSPEKYCWPFIQRTSNTLYSVLLYHLPQSCGDTDGVWMTSASWEAFTQGECDCRADCHWFLHFHCHHGLLQGSRPLTAQRDGCKVTAILCRMS